MDFRLLVLVPTQIFARDAIKKSQKETLKLLMHIGKQSNLLETSYLSHVSVGSELHTEMLTENCLLQQETTEPINKNTD